MKQPGIGIIKRWVPLTALLKAFKRLLKAFERPSFKVLLKSFKNPNALERPFLKNLLKKGRIGPNLLHPFLSFLKISVQNINQFLSP